MEQLELSYIAGKDIKRHFENRLAVAYKDKDVFTTWLSIYPREMKTNVHVKTCT